MDPLRIYDYLTTARGRIFDAVRPLASGEYHRQFPIGLKTISSTLTHVMISEWYYVQRMQERPVPPYEQWPIQDEKPPEFSVIEQTWREQAGETRGVIAAQRDWGRRASWTSFPNDQGKRFHYTGSAADFVAQMAFHEIHHRAQVLAMLRQLGRPLDGDIDFNALMFEKLEVTSGV